MDILNSMFKTSRCRAAAKGMYYGLCVIDDVKVTGVGRQATGINKR